MAWFSLERPSVAGDVVLAEEMCSIGFGDFYVAGKVGISLDVWCGV